MKEPLRILTVIGARPQIIKAAAISHAVRTAFSGRIHETLLHTGQPAGKINAVISPPELHPLRFGLPAQEWRQGVCLHPVRVSGGDRLAHDISTCDNMAIWF